MTAHPDLTVAESPASPTTMTVAPVQSFTVVAVPVVMPVVWLIVSPLGRPVAENSGFLPPVATICRLTGLFTVFVWWPGFVTETDSESAESLSVRQ